MKSTYETMGGNYQPNGNYLMPDFEVPESPKVGVWGERRRKYLREHQKALYTAMMLSDTLI
ncbi:MAG: TnpV protein [Oscillospiraceae bacterium]|nr:TnpV protein [Oscillospiraceae bacterium]